MQSGLDARPCRFGSQPLQPFHLTVPMHANVTAYMVRIGPSPSLQRFTSSARMRQPAVVGLSDFGKRRCSVEAAPTRPVVPFERACVVGAQQRRAAVGRDRRVLPKSDSVRGVRRHILAIHPVVWGDWHLRSTRSVSPLSVPWRKGHQRPSMQLPDHCRILSS